MLRRVVLAVGGAVLLAAASSAVSAHTTTTATVRWEAGPTAPSIGLIGDSTLSGVRWAAEYGDLRRFNFVFDAESCRRTVETSCWSREQYRPRNAITAMEDHAGEWGEVLVMMTGYNDSAGRFTDGVEAILDEARDQGIETVVWLSLRTKGVDYEEPLHLANGSTYRAANRSLYELADDAGGHLQIADWASYSADHPEWFEADGAHLAPDGVEPLTEFIAAQVDVVLAGGDVTADPAPWEEVRAGDEGDEVVDVQEALLRAGLGDVDVADGVFGPRTEAAVAAFQAQVGLPGTGVVDQVTATELGLRAAAPTTTTTPAATTAPPVAPITTPALATRSVPQADESGTDRRVWWVAAPLAAVLAAFAWRRPRRAGPEPAPVPFDDNEREPVAAVSERD